MRSVVCVAVLLLGGRGVAHATGPTITNPTIIALHGAGSQIYTCTTAPTGAAWRLTGPDATLTDAAGHTIGHHFAGPTWQAQDGSTVVGQVELTNAAPQPGSIPWLLLRAGSHTGAGLFAHVAMITRTQTEGGLAPAGGCDAAHAGVTRKVPYTAIYTLFSAP